MYGPEPESGSVSSGTRPMLLMEKPPSATAQNVLTYYGSAVHQPADVDGGPPVEVVTRYERKLDSKEQVYNRIGQVVRGTPRRIDLGWFSESPVGLVVLSNEEGERQFKVAPSDEERADMAKRVLAVSFDGGKVTHLLVRPGMSLPMLPTVLSALTVRSAYGGPVRYSVAVFPD